MKRKLLGLQICSLFLIKGIAQVWVPYNDNSFVSMPEKLEINAQGDLFVKNVNSIYFRDSSYTKWKKIAPFVSNGLFEVNPNSETLVIDDLHSIRTIQQVIDYNNYQGNSWNDFFPSGPNGLSAPVSDVIFDGNVLFAFATPDALNTKIMRRSNPGAAWSNIASISGYCTKSLKMSNGSYFCSIIENDDITGKLYYSNDQGVNWNNIYVNGSSCFVDLSIGYNNSIYAIQKESFLSWNDENAYSVVKSNDMGVTWQSVSMNLPIQKWNEIYYYAPESKFYMCGSKGVYSIDSVGVVTDVSMDLATNSFSSIVRYQDQLYCVATGNNVPKGVYKRDVSDQTWQLYSEGLFSGWYLNSTSPTFSFDSIGRIVDNSTYNGIVHEESPGNIWAFDSLSVLNTANEKIIQYEPVNGTNRIYVLKSDLNNVNKKLYLTQDFGQSVQELNVPDDIDKIFEVKVNGDFYFLNSNLEVDRKLYKYTSVSDTFELVHSFGFNFDLNRVFVDDLGNMLLNTGEYSNDNGQNFVNLMGILLPSGVNMNAFKYRYGSEVYGFDYDTLDNYILMKFNMSSVELTYLNDVWNIPSFVTLPWYHSISNYNIEKNQDTIFVYQNKVFFYSVDNGLTFEFLETPICNDQNDANPFWGYTNFGSCRMNNDNKLIAVFNDGGEFNKYYYLDFNQHLSVNSQSNIGEFTIFPNPVTDEFSIVCSEKTVKTEVYNELGDRMLTDTKDVINIAGFNTGVYFVRIYFENGNISTRKMVKL